METLVDELYIAKELCDHELLPSFISSHIGEWIQGPLLLNGNIVKCLVTLRSDSFKTSWVYNKSYISCYPPKIAKLANELSNLYPVDFRGC